MEPRACVLSDDEIVEIDKASIEVLSDFRVIVASEKALRLLDSAGAQVDYAKEIAKIPEDLVRKSISSSTRNALEMFDDTGSSCIRLEGKRTYNITGFDAIYTLDSHIS